jgi:hypothetical protein
MKETEAEQFIEDLLTGATYRNIHLKNGSENNMKQAVIERNIRNVWIEMNTYTYNHEQK